MDVKVAILREFASGNYGYALGRIAGTLVVTGLFLLLLGLLRNYWASSKRPY